MSAVTAIGMVSESLRNLLVGEMSLSPAVNVTILGPDETGGDRRINLFLYKVLEHPTLKNMDWQIKRGTSDTVVPPPLSLRLCYLMTPYAPSDAQTGNTSAHEILGDAMRVFYEHPLLSADYLVEGLQDAREQLGIIQVPLDMDELSKVWSTFTHPYRLSVLYEISVVQIDALPAAERTMATRVSTIKMPPTQAPFTPPIVDAIAPASGPAGRTISIRGRYLSGWSAYVTITGRPIVEAQKLAADQFDVTLPDNLPPGFNEIRVDISHLSRATFFFEITA